MKQISSAKFSKNPYLEDVWYTPQEDEQLNFTLSPVFTIYRKYK